MSAFIEINQAQLREVDELLKHIKNGSSTALSMAINKTTPKVRTKASAEIRKQVKLKAGYVRERLTLTKASRAKPSAAIQTPSRGLLLSHFDTKLGGTTGAVPVKGSYKDVKVKVKPTGRAKPVQGKPGNVGKPFYIRLKNSNRVGIAQRRPDGKIDVLHGPSLSQVFNDVKDQILPEASDELAKQLDQAAQFLIKKQALNENG